MAVFLRGSSGGCDGEDAIEKVIPNVHAAQEVIERRHVEGECEETLEEIHGGESVVAFEALEVADQEWTEELDELLEIFRAAVRKFRHA